MEHTLHKWYLPLWWTVWEFLIAFSEAACHRKIPLQSEEKKGWWAACKHRAYYVNTRVNTYVETHVALCAPIKLPSGQNQKGLTCSRAGCGLRLPSSLSFVFSTVVSASALIIDVSPCITQTMMERPWEVCRAAGWGTKQAPTHCVGPTLLRKGHSRAQWSRAPGKCLKESLLVCFGLIWQQTGFDLNSSVVMNASYLQRWSHKTASNLKQSNVGIQFNIMNCIRMEIQMYFIGDFYILHYERISKRHFGKIDASYDP